MRRSIIVLLTLVVSASAMAQCVATLDFAAIQPYTPITERPWNVTFANCPDATAATFTAGSSGTLTVGGVQYEAIIDAFHPPTPISPSPQVVFTLKLPQGAKDPLDVYYTTSTAVFSFPAGGQVKTWTLTLGEPLNVRTNSFHVGRADARGQSSNLPAIPPAYRLQIASTISYQPPFVGAGEQKTFLSKLERNFALKIDTTDKKTGYVDDNSVTAGAFLPAINLPAVLAQGKIGAQASYNRPLHTNDHDASATATASGLIRTIQAVNLFSTKRRLASPLSLTVSAGYKSKRMTGNDYRGSVFSGTAFYHVYVMDNYRIDLTATTTYNDLNKLPAGTSKTQHAFTAAVFYEPSPTAPFSAVASFQNGSFGAVLTKLKQYFIGVSVSKLDQFFGTGSP
jgi:hypothetical protein